VISVEKERIMKNSKSFYYKFNPINAWMFFNIILIAIFFGALFWCPYLAYWPQIQVLIGVLGFSVAVWAYKYAFKHRMALIDDKTIKIDHCEPIAWADIEYAEEKIVRCCFKNRKVIILKPKKGISYKYNFLQKHNAGFTPFSVPLYGILSVEDEKEIVKIIKEKLPFKE
jgi:hypothetical protein